MNRCCSCCQQERELTIYEGLDVSVCNSCKKILDRLGARQVSRRHRHIPSELKQRFIRAISAIRSTEPILVTVPSDK